MLRFQHLVRALSALLFFTDFAACVSQSGHQRVLATAPTTANPSPSARMAGQAAKTSLGPWPKSPVCLDGCSGHGSCGLSGHCDCYVGYFGSACEHQVHTHYLPTAALGVGGLLGNLRNTGSFAAAAEGECPEDCSNRGYCDSSTQLCHCDPGFSGEKCESDLCPSACSGHGTCLADGCKCHNGYVGTDCATRNCPQDCSRHGFCGNGTCFCFPGFHGPACGVSHCPGSNRSHTCNGHGTCLPPVGSSAANSATQTIGTCQCEPGYFGMACEVKLCGDAGALCHIEHGTCVNSSGTRAGASSRCSCRHGYSGPECSTPPKACPADCKTKPGGRCVDGVCQTECDRRCTNGICRNGTCLCKDGFEGPWCAQKSCAQPCKHGVCDGKTGTCICDAGFESPPDCQRALCQHACNGHGICEEHGLLPHHGLCVCQRGWGGRFCERISCPRGCWHNGSSAEWCHCSID